jgi:hypothetical protein
MKTCAKLVQPGTRCLFQAIERLTQQTHMIGMLWILAGLVGVLLKLGVTSDFLHVP